MPRNRTGPPSILPDIWCTYKLTGVAAAALTAPEWVPIEALGIQADLGRRVINCGANCEVCHVLYLLLLKRLLIQLSHRYLTGYVEFYAGKSSIFGDVGEVMAAG